MITDDSIVNLAAGMVVAVPQDERAAIWEPSWDRPPVRRPDLKLLGDGRRHHGLEIRADARDLHRR